MRFDGALDLPEMATPGSPGSGRGKIFVGVDGRPYFLDENNVARALLDIPSAVHDNPGFENPYTASYNFTPSLIGDAPGGWNYVWCSDGVIGSRVAAISEGQYAAKLAKPAGAGIGARFHGQNAWSCSGGDVVSFEVDIQGSGAVATGTVSIEMFTNTTAGGADLFQSGVIQSYSTFSYNSSKKRVKVTFTVPPGHLFGKFSIYFDVTGNGAGALTIDNSESTVTTPATSNALASWPVGAVYLSMVNVNPSAIFGGTWARVANGRMLVGVDEGDASFDTARETGGAKTHTLTVAEMPSHSHYAGTLSVERRAAAGTGVGLARGNATAVDNYGFNGAVQANGGGDPHNNMPPYFTVYMFERTA